MKMAEYTVFHVGKKYWSFSSQIENYNMAAPQIVCMLQDTVMIKF
jgi:hypothetical protein